MSTHSLKEWNEVLDTVERSVEEALAAVNEQQQALDSLVQSWRVTGEKDSAWVAGLEEHHHRVQELSALAEKAGESVKEVDDLLAQEETALQEWLAATGKASQNLQRWLDAADPHVPESLNS